MRVGVGVAGTFGMACFSCVGKTFHLVLIAVCKMLRAKKRVFSSVVLSRMVWTSRHASG